MAVFLLCVWRTITNAISDRWHVVVSFIKVEDSISFPYKLVGAAHDNSSNTDHQSYSWHCNNAFLSFFSIKPLVVPCLQVRQLDHESGMGRNELLMHRRLHTLMIKQ